MIAGDRIRLAAAHRHRVGVRACHLRDERHCEIELGTGSETGDCAGHAVAVR